MSAAFCRECLTRFEPAPGAASRRCPSCRSPRVVVHPELDTLAIAHVDCDAFYAAIEKRDDPSLRDRPVIVGGGRRGVVATCCYIARIKGVRSAMPMFKARALCPEAVVISPRMETYHEASGRIRRLFEALTPLVEPLSLDEAFLDLSGTERLHGAPPALVLARLQARIEVELGVTVSVGLSWNKFLAKLASERDKPRGFAMIGRAETEALLVDLPVTAIWGVGAATATALRREGLSTLGDLRRAGREALVSRHGVTGERLHALAWGRDTRAITSARLAKSLSSETTFETDLEAGPELEAHLWRLAIALSDRLKAKGLAGQVVTLKLRRSDFRLFTRRRRLDAPSQLADALHHVAAALLAEENGVGPFRLIGVSASELKPADATQDAARDLFDSGANARARAERAVDEIRRRFGKDAIGKGRALAARPERRGGGRDNDEGGA